MHRHLPVTVPPLDLVRLTPLMARTAGSAAVPIGLIDGPIAASHPDLAAARLEVVGPERPTSCEHAQSDACQHGTFVAGMLSARRGGVAPAIAPECPLLAYPLFPERPCSGMPPRAHPDALAHAVLECVAAGVRVLNVSAALVGAAAHHSALEAALGRAARRGVIVIAAAGNEGTLTGTVLSRHPWVVPVASCDGSGRPAGFSNIGASIARTGLRAPGVRLTSVAPGAGTLTLTGTSAAVPFVSGTAALLWSAFPTAPAAAIRVALAHATRASRRSIVPPLLDAWAAFLTMRGM